MNILLLSRRPEYIKMETFLVSKGNAVIFESKPIGLDFLKKNRIDFIVSYLYAPIVKGVVIEEYKQRIVNIHNSYLPYGRGIYPNLWSFFEGTPSGVTIHFIDEGIDTGDIIFQEKVSLSDNDTLRSSYAKLSDTRDNLFFSRWDDILKKNTP